MINLGIPDDLTEYLAKLVTPFHTDGQILYIAGPGLTDWDALEDDTYHAALLVGDPSSYIEHLWRVLKPGAHVLAVAPEDQPTGHTGAIALEDQGFEIRDAILWADEPGKYHYVPKPSQRERHAGCENLKVHRKIRDQIEELDDDLDGDDLLDAVAEIEEEADDEPIELHAHKGNAHPCLHPDALVMTDRGYRPISEIQVGSKVYSADGRFHSVEAVSRHPYTSPNLFEIQVMGTNYTTPASDNHPFLIWRPTRKRKHVTGGEVLWLPADQIQKGDYTMTPDLFDDGRDADSAKIGWWFVFGLWVAEGVAQQAGHGENLYPSFTLHQKETDLIDRIRAVFAHVNTSVYPKKGSKAVQVMAFDSKAGARFVELAGRGASTKSLCPTLWDQPWAVRKAILDGYMAGDGGKVRTYLQAKTVSPDLASQIRLLAASVGYKANLFTYPAVEGKGIGDRKFKTVLPTYQIRLYSDNADHREKGTRKTSRPQEVTHQGVRYILSYVKAATQVPYSGDVVNLSVEGSPTFQTAVGMSHNTVKPKAIMARLLEDVPKTAKVLDPFMGSGGTALACLETGHDFTGIERETDYLEISDTRVRYHDRARIGDGADIESEHKPLEIKQEAVDLDDFFDL